MYRIEAESIIKDYESTNLNLDEFINGLEFHLINKSENTLEFDLKGCHPSLANALRRILISQVSTLAVHNVSISENNTVFPDEYIAHRLGLIPLVADSDDFVDFQQDEEAYNNVLNFKLEKANNTSEIIQLVSDDIEFIPIDGQEDFNIHFKPGVVICKMAPGNEISMAMQAIKGKGEQHTKRSPVPLCSYRIMPHIILEKAFFEEDAVELQKCFSPGVIEIINKQAVVVNPRLDSLSREVLRHDKFKENVKILRESGWFCFTVESISEDPLNLVKKAIKVLIGSCKNLKEEIRVLGEHCNEY